MINVEIEYSNYDEVLHKHFPVIKNCSVYSKNEIINVEINSSFIIYDLGDDLGFDSNGRYIGISFGEWRHETSGEKILEKEFYMLEESEAYRYVYVSATIKIYTEENYLICYANSFNKNIKFSLIPRKLLDFTKSNCDLILR